MIMATDDQLKDMSDEAADMLLNAERHVGGRLGIGNAWEELETLGLIGPRDRLTREGARVAKLIQREYWGI